MFARQREINGNGHSLIRNLEKIENYLHASSFAPVVALFD